MRRTKIVATLGPASSNPELLKQLMEAGVDVFRVNFSHGTREANAGQIAMARRVCSEMRGEIAVIQDLCGPKIRTGIMKDGAVTLETGSEVTVTTVECVGTQDMFSTIYSNLPRDVKPGSRILLDDGKLELEVLSVAGKQVRCRVIRGGMLKDHKGMNLPYAAISSPSVTEKDLADLESGIEAGVDYVALSFIRHPDDLKPVRELFAKRNCKAQVISKIERPEAIERLDDIIAASDGILVARGDLGIEMDIATVPLLQKDMIRRANEQDKYVITATQMLESMMESEMPTRAEVADISNAIIDGTDAVMLSGETAVGKYPLDAVKMMARIAVKTEEYLVARPAKWDWQRINATNPVQDAIGHAAFRLCKDLKAGAVVAFSVSGGTALYISKSRPSAPILAFTNDVGACRRMRLFWGVIPVLEPSVRARDDLLSRAGRHLAAMKVNGPILLVAGKDFGQIGGTNTIEVVTL